MSNLPDSVIAALVSLAFVGVFGLFVVGMWAVFEVLSALQDIHPYLAFAGFVWSFFFIFAYSFTKA